MAKIVVNRCFGGFGLSNKALRRYVELKGEKLYFYQQTQCRFDDGTDLYEKVNPGDKEEVKITYTFTKDQGESFTKFPEGNDTGYLHDRDIDRCDPDLVKVVEELGEEASGWAANLKVVEIPDDLEWEIDDYDGRETIHEKHRSW